MHRCPAIVTVAAALLCTTDSPHVRRIVPSGASGDPARAAARAALLARHGESALAFDALRAAAVSHEASELAARLLTELGRYAEADSVLAQFVPSASSGGTFLYYLRRARLNQLAGRLDAAMDCLAAIDVVSDDTYSAYRDCLAVQLHRARGDPAAAAASLGRALAGEVPDGLRSVLDDERVALYRTIGRNDEALAVLSSAIDAARNEDERRRLLRARFEVASEAGRPTDARRTLSILATDFPGSEEAEECASEALARFDWKTLDARDLLVCAEVLAARGVTEEMRPVLRALDKRALDARHREWKRLLWAEYHYRSGSYERSIVLSRPPYANPSLSRRSVLLLARSCRAVGRRAEAARVYEAFATRHPNDPLAAEALHAAASLYEQSDDEAASWRMLDRLRRSYPSTFFGWAAAISRAREHEALGEWDRASEIIEQRLARSRRTDEAALYYKARHCSAAGDHDASELLLRELQALNPYSFYLAPEAGVVRRDPPATDAAPEPLEAWLERVARARDRAYARVLESVAPDSPSAARDRQVRSLERGRIFLAMGLRDWAESELEAARARGTRSSDETLLLARLYEEHGMPWQSVRLYERVRGGVAWDVRRALANDFRHLTHPVPYPAQIVEIAARHNLPPHLVYAIIREESRFEAGAVSRAGAVGLMQLMPGTARRVASKLDLAPDVADRLDDPGTNISLGVWYAAELLQRGEGNVPWMLVAYNAGPGNASRWVDPTATSDGVIDGVESIDYWETRGYVKRVVESANTYHALYFGGEKPAARTR